MPGELSCSEISLRSEAEEFKQIKPKEGMTVEQARNFWDSLFSKEVSVSTESYDSNKSELKEGNARIGNNPPLNDGGSEGTNQEIHEDSTSGQTDESNEKTEPDGTKPYAIADEGDEIDDLPDVDDKEDFFAGGIERTRALLKKVDKVFQTSGLDAEKHIERRDKMKDIVRYLNPLEMLKSVAYFSAVPLVTKVNCFYRVIDHYSPIDLDETIVGDIKNIYDDVITPQFVKVHLKGTLLDSQAVAVEMTELTCKAVDAATYIGDKVVLGAAGVAEDAVAFAVGTIAGVAGHPEVAEKIYQSDITGKVSDYVDEKYDGSELVKDIGSCAEKVGEIGAYIGLGVLAGSESAVVAPIATAAIGAVRAGEATRAAVEKTGEYTHKELVYGIVSGIAEIVSQKAVSLVHTGMKNLGESLAESTKSIDGKIAQYIAEKVSGVSVAAGEGAINAGIYDLKNIIKNYVACALEIDDKAEVDFKKIAKDVGMGALASGVIFLASDTLKDIGDYIGKEQDEEIKRVEFGEKELDSTKRKGNYGEMKTDQNLRERGYERIAGDMITDIDASGHQGIDGVYYNPDGHPPYMIVDAKFGTAQLLDTLDGKQMSDAWIDKRLDMSVGKEKADEIRMEKLLHPDRVGMYVSHVDEKGNITFDRLDGNANIVEKDVKINVKRLD